MVRCHQGKEFTQHQAVGAAPVDTAFALELPKVLDKEHAEVGARHDRGTHAVLKIIIRLTEVLGKMVESMRIKNLVESLIEWVLRRASQLIVFDQEACLFLGHASIHWHLHTLLNCHRVYGYGAGSDDPFQQVDRVILGITLLLNSLSLDATTILYRNHIPHRHLHHQ